MTLFLTTVLLGAATSGLIYLLTRRWMTPALLYWVGWALGVGAAESMSGDGLMPVLTETGRELILRLHVGAAVGFVLGAVFYLLARNAGLVRSASRGTVSGERLQLSSRLVGGALLVQLGVGITNLGYRLAELGGIGGLMQLADIRQAYLRSAYLVDTLPPLVRLSHHLDVALSIFPFLFALQDAADGKVRWKRLLVWWLAAVPGGLATGGRGWVIAAPTLYAISFVVAGGVLNWSVIRPWLIRGVVVLAAMIGLFSFIEQVRVRDTGSRVLFEASRDGRWYDHVLAIKPVVYYVGLPSLAVETYSNFAESEGRRYGGVLTFPFVGEQLLRFGLLDANHGLEFFRTGRMAAFAGPDPVLGATHSTLVPRLVADFGSTAYPFVMVGLALLMQAAFFILVRGGVVARLIAVQLVLYGGFWTFQDFMLGTAASILPVLWLSVALFAGQLLHAARCSRSQWVSLRRHRLGEPHGALSQRTAP